MKISGALLCRAAWVTLLVFTPYPRASAADFIPEKVFAGRSTGEGTLKLLFGKPRPFTVESMGNARADGTLELQQTITFQDRPAQSRTWVMHRTGPNTYSATLTDAAGPVKIRTEGNRMEVRYPLKRWGLSMHQTLDLAADGLTVANQGRIQLVGTPVGWLEETIQLGD